MQSTAHSKIGQVLADLHREASNNVWSEGDTGLVASTFAALSGAYIGGVMRARGGIGDLDGFAIMMLLDLARQANEPRPCYDTARELAAHAAMRAAACAPEPQPVGPMTDEDLTRLYFTLDRMSPEEKARLSTIAEQQAAAKPKHSEAQQETPTDKDPEDDFPDDLHEDDR